jgi:hypothetical protein
VGCERRSLFNVENRRSGLWVVWGDLCLGWRNRRSGVEGDEGAIAVLVEGIGDRVLWVVRGDRYLMWGRGDRVCSGEGRSLFDVI